MLSPLDWLLGRQKRIGWFPGDSFQEVHGDAAHSLIENTHENSQMTYYNQSQRGMENPGSYPEGSIASVQTGEEERALDYSQGGLIARSGCWEKSHSPGLRCFYPGIKSISHTNYKHQ